MDIFNLNTLSVSDNHTIEPNQYKGIRLRNFSEDKVTINENITLLNGEKWKWINDEKKIATPINIRFSQSKPTNRVEIQLFY